MDVSTILIDEKNNVQIPSLGFGTAFGNWTDKSKFFGFTPEQGWSAIPAALRSGYRHFDCALLYGTQTIVGNSLGSAFKDGVIQNRDEIFVTTKVCHPEIPIALNTLGKSFPFDKANSPEFIRDRIMTALETSLAELNLGYVDLLLVHWPGNFGTFDTEKQSPDERTEAQERGKAIRIEIWKTFEEIYKSGRARSIGVSNFLERHFDFLEECEIQPAVNQIEINPYNQQRAIWRFCEEKKIRLCAWSPFGSGNTGLLSDPAIVSIGEKYKKNTGQVILRWLVQQNVVALPKSGNEKRMKSNLDIFDFELTSDDIASINALDKGFSAVGSPDSIA